MRKVAIPFISVVVLLALAGPVRSDVPVALNVTYSGCSVVEGPLSLGLASLPSTIQAKFVFLSPSFPPPSSGAVFEPEVVFAELRLGDLLSTAANLQYFRLAFFPNPDGGLDVSQLTWLGKVESTDTACGIDQPNSSFQIDITGTTRSSPDEPCPGKSLAASTRQTSGEFFHYHCGSSDQTFSQVAPTDVRIGAKKLLVLSRPAKGKGKTVLTVSGSDAALVSKGSGTDPDKIAAHLKVFYIGASGEAVAELAVGQGVLEQGDRRGWKSNTTKLAQYLNRDAPDSPGDTKKTLIKPGKKIKLVAKSEGDVPLDLLGAGPPTSTGVVTVYTVINDGEMIRHCTRFPASSCTYKELADATAAKLVCRNGAGIACPIFPCLPANSECSTGAECCSGLCPAFQIPRKCL